MKKKLLSVLLSTAMVAALLVGCNSTEPATEATDPTEATDASEATDPTEEVQEVKGTFSNGGAVLNIYCWNDEFERRLTAHCDGYVDNGDGTGSYKDTKIVWNITPSDDNAYQNNLDATLLKQADAPADEKIDLFLVEADYALKYVNTDYTVDVREIGLTDADLADQYGYTQDIVTDANGVLKGVSWQACPGVMCYRRSIAEDVLGVSEPADVQPYVADWAKFDETAAAMKEKGYFMVSGYDDTYRVFSNNATQPWVTDGVVSVGPEIDAWIDQTKTYTDNGYNNKASLWSTESSNGLLPEGKVFSYFLPAWYIDFCFPEGAASGDFAATEGPQGFFWGGTWICCANYTDNADLIKEIMYTMTCDAAVIKEIVVDDNDFGNNQASMEEMAADTTYGVEMLGGQNPLGIYAAGAVNIDMANCSIYDQGCNEEIQGAMKDYFDGNCTKEEALANFYAAITVKYPELTAGN